MLLFKTRAAVFAALLSVLLAGGGAYAATGGHIPVISDSFGLGGSVSDDAYGNHGRDVSAVARDKDALGTKTNKNGKVIENHGQAVREAAHQKDAKVKDDVSDDVSDDSSDEANGDADDDVGAAKMNNRDKDKHTGDDASADSGEDLLSE